MDKHHYQVVRKDELQHGLSFQKLGRKTAKYIAKIKKGAKTRYIYTQKELEAYKRALSSKDEVNKHAKAYEDLRKAETNLKNTKNYRSVKTEEYDNHVKSATKLHGIDNIVKKSRIAPTIVDKYGNPIGLVKDRQNRIRSDRDKSISEYKEAKKQYSNAKREMTDATKNLERSKTLKGKAEDVRDTYRQFHPKQAKAIDKGKKKVDKFIKDTKTKANAYGKALSSEDEKKEYNTNKKAMKLANKIIDQALTEGDVFTALEINDARNIGKSELNKTKKAYERAKTLKGKAEDVRDTYRQFHPKKKKKKS